MSLSSSSFNHFPQTQLIPDIFQRVMGSLDILAPPLDALWLGRLICQRPPPHTLSSITFAIHHTCRVVPCLWTWGLLDFPSLQLECSCPTHHLASWGWNPACLSEDASLDHRDWGVSLYPQAPTVSWVCFILAPLLHRLASLPGWQLPQNRTFCPIQMIKVALKADPPECKLLFHHLLAV